MKTIDGKIVLRGEIMLAISVVMNALGVLLMLHSGSGISAISSVPYAMNLVWPQLTLGTWTYLFQGALVLVLMILSRRFVPSYLFSFVVGFAFGEMMDVWHPFPVSGGPGLPPDGPVGPPGALRPVPYHHASAQVDFPPGFHRLLDGLWPPVRGDPGTNVLLLHRMPC